MRIDHAVLAVADLDAAAERLLDATGLDSVPGGTHAAWGTANRIVPLGEDYVELMAVVDPGVAAGTVLGRAVLAIVNERSEGWFTICVRDPGIEATAARLGLAVVDGGRTRPDGVQVRWRHAGVEDVRRAAWLPFFIDWLVPDDLLPGRAAAAHRVRPTGIEEVTVGGDPAVLRAWVGVDGLPIVADPAGPPGIRAVRVGLADGAAVTL